MSTECRDGGAQTEEPVGICDQAAPRPDGTSGGRGEPTILGDTSLCHPQGLGCDLGLLPQGSTVLFQQVKQAVLVTSLPEPRGFGDRLPMQCFSEFLFLSMPADLTTRNNFHPLFIGRDDRNRDSYTDILFSKKVLIEKHFPQQPWAGSCSFHFKGQTSKTNPVS